MKQSNSNNEDEKKKKFFFVSNKSKHNIERETQLSRMLKK